jgi:alkylation response protein AidB-like acyl-CoA dehydrogenase
VIGPDRRVVDELHAFLESQLPEFQAEFGDRGDFEAGREWQRRLDSGGWVGLNWSVEYGGRALDLATHIACENALSEAGAPQIAGFIGVNTVAAAIMRWGSEEQKRFLPGIRSAELVFCQGFSEPEAGSDLASLRTRAEVTADGFVLNGQKVWTSHGGDGDQCLVLARTTPVKTGTRSHRGLSLFLVPLGLPGVMALPIEQLNGDKEFCELFFDDVFLPTSALVGPLDEGWRVAMSTLAHERAAAMMLAMRTRAQVRKAAARHAPSAPAYRRDDLLRLYVDAEVLGLLAERSIAEIGAGTVGPAQSVVKLAWSQTDQKCAELFFDLHGPAAAAGLAPAASDALLFSRSSTIAAGSTEVMRNILSEQVLGLPRSDSYQLG